MRRFLLSSIVLGLLVAGCNGDAESTTTTSPPTTQAPVTVNTDTLQRFDSPELGFAISYPDQWTIAPSIGEGLVEFSAPLNEGGFTPNFNIATGTVPADVPVNVYYDGERSKLQSNFTDVQVLEEADVNVDGVLGRGITIVTDLAGTDVGISRLIVLRDGRAWEITFFAEATQLEELAPLVTAIFQSFEFLP